MISQLHGLVILIEPPGAGKSTFTRGLVARGVIDEAAWISNDRIAIEMFGDALEREVHDSYIFAEQDRHISDRLANGLVTVVDATNVRSEARSRLIALAEPHGQPVTAIRFTIDDQTLLKQNRNPDRGVVLPDAFVLEYAAIMRGSTSDEQLRAEGIVSILESKA